MSVERKHILKMVVLGDSSVGKTSVIRSFCNRSFSECYKATIGCDFLSTDFKIDDKEVSVQMWDTAGQERFQSLGVAFYRGSDCCILTYDITSSKSFESLRSWKDEFLQYLALRDNQRFPFLVIGNKSDRESERTVSFAKASEWAQNNNLLYFEVSAKTGDNVHESITAVVKAAMQSKEVIDYTPRIELKPTQPKKKIGCCA